MERTRPGLGHSSTYGQACMQCYKAKCRCVPSSSGAGCERCLRLRKECRPSDSSRRRDVQKAEESDARIARLESKIETLLSAMQSIASSSGSSPEIVRLLNEETISSSTSSTNNTPANSTGNPSINVWPPFQTDLPPPAPTDTNPFSPSSYPPVASDVLSTQAEEALKFFRFRMLPYFPFISFDPNITAWQLHQDRPFLFQAILTVTTFSTQSKLVRAEELKRILFTSAFLNVQSNIDLLLGLLTYLAWSTDAFLGAADFVSRLMMLAISLVYDLRLFKQSPPDVKLLMTMTQGQAYESDQNANEESVQALMEKQRAVLACFVLSSNISSHVGRIDALRWTPQMEEALRVISTSKLCPTDEALGLQVRLLLIKQRASYFREQHEVDRGRAAASAVTSVPGLLYLKALQGQLRELVSSFPSNLYQREILIIYAQYVELYINQLAYSISRDSPRLNMSEQRSDGGLLPGFERLECLWHSVESIKSWLDSFYRIPPSELVGLPFHFWSQMILCITILKYLSVLEDPAWDRQAVRNTVDVISTMDCMILKLDLSSEEPGLESDDNLFKLLSRLLSKARAWASARSNVAPQALEQDDGPHVADSPSHNYIPDLDQMVWIQSMDLESDQWFEDLMGWPSSSF